MHSSILLLAQFVLGQLISQRGALETYRMATTWYLQMYEGQLAIHCCLAHLVVTHGLVAPPPATICIHQQHIIFLKYTLHPYTWRMRLHVRAQPCHPNKPH